MNDKDEQVLLYILEEIRSKQKIKDSTLKLELKNKFGVDESKRIELMSLLHEGLQIEIKQEGSEVIYYEPSSIDMLKTDLSNVEEVLLESIQKSGSLGVGKQELKSQLRINLSLLSKKLTQLQRDGYIVCRKTKKRGQQLYFSAECVPDSKLVGGSFYKNGELSMEIVEETKLLIFNMIDKKGKIEFSELIRFVSSSVLGSSLTQKEITQVINQLLLENKVRKLDNTYLETNTSTQNKNIYNVPCTNCRLLSTCSINGKISPFNCTYFENW